jgi:hypothetical protein
VVRCEKDVKRGKHRTEVTEVTEGEIWGWMGRRTAGEHGGSVRERREEGKDAKRGKHRTEVTEVTEGNWGWMGRGAAGEHGGSVRERREERESIAQRSRRSQRGEIWGWMVGRTAGAHGGFRAGKTRRGEKHRTEVTEEENFRMAAVVRASPD